MSGNRDDLRTMLEERDFGRSEFRDEFNDVRKDDPSTLHENAHLADDSRHQPQIEERRETLEESRMVKDDQPRHEMHPPDELRKPVDRESFDERWQSEIDRADYGSQEPQQDRGQDHDFDRDR